MQAVHENVLALSDALEAAPVVLVVGEAASGKSVTWKLLHSVLSRLSDRESVFQNEALLCYPSSMVHAAPVQVHQVRTMGVSRFNCFIGPTREPVLAVGSRQCQPYCLCI